LKGLLANPLTEGENFFTLFLADQRLISSLSATARSSISKILAMNILLDVTP
jgi:hypothetical protein